ncbi:MAG TPA: hypothetical protein VEQ10_08995 [Vicinamibacteria bacterium]|nr:hypothetical protein [Vicinamibacteria bacterium]
MSSQEPLENRIRELEKEVAALRGGVPARLVGVRKRSSATWAGLPLYDIALGPDPEHGQWRGHAKGVLAIGDMATGVVALGGLARGVVALGGLAVGLLSFGGLSIGVLCAVGGLAIGSLAVGGGAVGGTAIGGGAVGYYYACGGGAFGGHVVDAMRSDPEAVDFFREHGLSAVCGAGARRPSRRW